MDDSEGSPTTSTKRLGNLDPFRLECHGCVTLPAAEGTSQDQEICVYEYV